MYNDIETKLGKEVFDIIDEYNALKTYGETAAEYKAFYKKNKKIISSYYDLKDEWQVVINRETAKLAANLEEGQGVNIREDIDVTSPSVQNLTGALQPEKQPSFEEFSAIIPKNLMNMVQDYFLNGDALTASGERQLERIAYDMNYEDADDLLQAIGQSMYSQQP